MDVIVVGAGYWGVGITLRLRNAGHRVYLIDDADPRGGSRNASGICDPAAYRSEVFRKYWPADWQEGELKDSLAWLIDSGVGRRVRESFWNVYKGTQPRAAEECVYLDSPSTLLGRMYPVRRGKVCGGRVSKSGCQVLLSDGTELAASHLVVAAGYRTDEVLTALEQPRAGVSALYGRGIVVRGLPDVLTPVSVMVAPYRKHTVRHWGRGDFKVGDTAEPKDEGHERHLGTLRAVADAVFPDGYSTVGTTAGYRPVTDRYHLAKHADRLIVATGGNRVALGLTGLVAKRVEGMVR